MQNSSFFPRRWAAALVLLVATLILSLSAHADPAGRIGRISLLSGTVNLFNPNSGESFAAPLNQPLTSGDILSTGPGSHSEIQIGSMTVRLDAGSRLELDRIDDEQVRLYLADGRSIVKLSSPDAVNDFVMETRNGRFTARRTGIYRFDTDANSTTGTAYYGTLHFETSDSSLDIGSGQHAQFWQDGQTRYRMLTPPQDEFTQWSAARDQRPAANTYSRYVSPEMTGAEDLDAYGNWSETPEFGAIWYPRSVAPDWAPYRSGHWAWVTPWGWSWVGDEPWGFAPFHYGRWVQHRGAWGWVPGTRIARPVYAPAMVAWVGTPGVSVSFSIGSRPTVGWFPLAPREVYIPAFRSSPNYVRNVNITHVTRITNVEHIVSNPQAVIQNTHYVHRDMPRALTVVPADVVTQRRPVAEAAIPHREHREMNERPVQAAAPFAAPRFEPGNREERANPGFARREHEQQVPVVVTPRNERPMPEVVRPVAQARPDVVEPRRQEAPAPVAAQQTAPQNDNRPRQDRPDHRFARPDREQQPQAVAAPQAQPPAPQAIIQRNDRPMPEVIRQAPPVRQEAVEPRIHERPRAIEAARKAQLPRENRVEAVQPPPVRQAPPPRIETPLPAREMARQADIPRPEARPQQHQRQPQQDEEELRRRRKQEGEKH